MENWGLIFCQKQLIVYEPNIQTNKNRQLISDVISHEIAHMVNF